jgi:penicillin-binding protein 1A
LTAIGRGLQALFRGVLWTALFCAGLLVLHTYLLIERLDVSRDGLQARARSVEAVIVPSQIAGAGGKAYNAALEAPLSLPPERIPRFVQDAFIAREDQLFRWHPGFNPVAFVRAFKTNSERSARGISRRAGGSTITMQLVKNLLLHQQQTLDRKLNEVILAVVVEWLFSKDEIMAMYLNTAYFGAGAYGVEAAARRFFGRSIGYDPKVDGLEAAMLALSVQRPSQLNPLKNRKLLEAKARDHLDLMAAEGYRVARSEKARDRGERSWRLDPLLFRDVAMRSMIPAELKGRDDRLVLGLTVDTEAQLYADLAATDLLKRGRASGYDSSAIVLLEPDGAIAALAIGHDYNGVDLVRDGRVSPGSTLKPFLVLCALENGMRPDSLVEDEKRAFRPGWVPRNFDGRYLGTITLDAALRKSRNTSAVALFDRFGPECFADILARVGVTLDHPRAPTSVLGSEHVSLLDLAGAYASLANAGQKTQPYAVRYARETNGAIVYRRAPPEALGRISAEQPFCDLLLMLRNVVRADGTGHNAAFGHPVYGKTGTSQNYRDALFAGFTGHYTAVIWLGRQARGNPSGRITGGELPAEAFRWLMATLHDGKEQRDLGCKAPIRLATRSSPSSRAE